MSETSNQLSRSCLTIAIVIGAFILLLLIIGVGVVIYSLQSGGI